MGDLIVKAPKKMSLEEIFSFIDKKSKWIEDRQSTIKKQIEENYKLLNYQNIIFLGKKYDVCEVENLNENYLTENALFVKKTISVSKKKKTIVGWYLQNVENILINRIVELSKKMQIKFQSIKIVSSKQKWGMCDQKHNLYFNWKLLFLSPNLIDYVIIHELSHILELNHSKNFWELVKSIYPNFKTARQLLNECPFLIKLF